MTQTDPGRGDRQLARAIMIVTGLVMVALVAAFVSFDPGSACPAAAASPSREAAIPRVIPGATGQPVHLAVLGDVGTGDIYERAIADLVAEAEVNDEYQALVLLGDNVYPDGRPSRLDSTVFEPFKAVLDDGTFLLPVLGNHDVMGGHACGQVEVLGMPGRWYATTIGTVLFIALDSNMVRDTEQTRWLQSTLAYRRCHLAGGGDASPCLFGGLPRLHPRGPGSVGASVREYDVDLVLTGHDHDYQRTMPINDVTYIVSGGGSSTRPTGDADYIAMARSVRHFLDVSISTERLDVTAISAAGPFDHVTITKLQP